MKVSLYRILVTILLVFFTSNICYADIVRISEDKVLPYNKDFNNDGSLIVTIDAGHGGSETGTIRNKFFIDDGNNVKFLEKDITLKVSKLVNERINTIGNVKSFLTRNSDIDLSLTERGNIAGQNKSDLMVSIHFNSASKINNSPVAMGAEIWQSVVNMYKPIGLPKAIFKELNKNHFLQVIRGVRERVSGDSYWDYANNTSIATNNGNDADYYGVIKAGCKNRVPTIILECSFFTNDNDMTNIASDEYINELSNRIADGILNFFSEG